MPVSTPARSPYWFGVTAAFLARPVPHRLQPVRGLRPRLPGTGIRSRPQPIALECPPRRRLSGTGRHPLPQLRGQLRGPRDTFFAAPRCAPVPAIDTDACTGCGTCLSSCANQALKLEPIHD
ncbi:ATP-binding protein [Marinobacterium aestuariivivens]|uniref:ATP-binding protein n=1 Tax=Marinobacterium aestuariivivens TaxID=1698799 RepID=A0ABW2A500_9GAMM